MTVSVCIGSACHLKGSKDIVEGLQKLIADNGVGEQVELKGVFCTNHCMEDGVSVKVDDKRYSLKPENLNSFFETEVLGQLA